MFCLEVGPILIGRNIFDDSNVSSGPSSKMIIDQAVLLDPIEQVQALLYSHRKVKGNAKIIMYFEWGCPYSMMPSIHSLLIY